MTSYSSTRVKSTRKTRKVIILTLYLIKVTYTIPVCIFALGPFNFNHTVLHKKPCHPSSMG